MAEDEVPHTLIQPSSAGELVARPPIHVASFDRLDPDRFDRINLYYEDRPDLWRYQLRIIDRSTRSPIQNATAVFLIPTGRESDYIFTSRKGLSSIAESSSSARLLAIALGRGHAFDNQGAVQQELEYVIGILSRQGTFVPPSMSVANRTNVPFLAMAALSERNIVRQGTSALSGEYVVEQVEMDGRLVRRLFFGDNPMVVQSEVVLHQNGQVDGSHVAFDYHKTVVAGILALGQTLDRGLLIGLGGGGLVNYLHYLQPNLQLMAVELDPVVTEVAGDLFGVNLTKLDLRIGNGLHLAVDEGQDEAIVIEPESLSFLVLDVDSKDQTVGMSCPPQAFVETAYLERLAAMLSEDGILAVNVSARDQRLLDGVCLALDSVLEQVWVSKEEDGAQDLNVVVFGCQNAVTLGLERLAQALPQLDETTIADLELSLSGLRRWMGDKKTPKKKKKKGKKGKGR